MHPDTLPPTPAPVPGSDSDSASAAAVDAAPARREFSAEEIRRLAALARLDLADAELPAAARALGDIMTLVAQMERLHPDRARELTHVSAAPRLRDDAPVAPDNRDELLANAPQAADGFFLTPKVVE